MIESLGFFENEEDPDEIARSLVNTWHELVQLVAAVCFNVKNSFYASHQLIGVFKATLLFDPLDFLCSHNSETPVWLRTSLNVW